MANNNFDTPWNGVLTHDQVEAAIKAKVAELMDLINEMGVPQGGITIEMLANSLRSAINSAYQKPSTGIPASDLAQAVRSILNDVANKVDAVPGKGLSTNDYTDAEKTKLAGIAAGAQVNVINGINKHDGTPIAPDGNGIVTLPEQTDVDLDDYYDKDEVEAAIANKLSNVIVNNIPAGSVAIIDDTTTGGRANAWSAEQGKLMANRSNLAAQRIALLRQLLEHAVFNGDVTDIFDALEALDTAVESITLNQSSLTFSGSTSAGATQTLVATTDPAGANVSWSSSNTSVATVNNGVVTTVGNGTCVITASAGGLSATCNVAVSGILAVYEISLGTLSHVSVTDGNGDAISDGDEITEGSALTIVLTPDASHVIDTASVTMGGVAQTLTDGQDGEKTLTIASVSGDIAISASATYQAKDYAAGVEVIDNYGVNPSGGTVGTSNSIKSKVFELDFGKTYLLSDYDWNEHNGTSNGYNFAFCKSDGNGGYTNIKTADVTKPADMGIDPMDYVNGGNIYCVTSSSGAITGKKDIIFTVLPKSAFTGVDKIYLCINTQWATGYACIGFHVRELVIEDYLSMTAMHLGYSPNIGKLITENNNYVCRLYAVDAGSSYTFSDYGADGISDRTAYMFGIIASVDGVLRSLTQAEVSNIDSFFTASSYASRIEVPRSGGFTMPNISDISAGGSVARLFLCVNTKWSSDFDMTDFTLTENS